MNTPLPEPRWRARATHPRLILAHSLEQVHKLARIQGGRTPVEYGTYAREHDLSLPSDTDRSLEEHRDALQKDVEFYNGRFDAVLYHVITESDWNNDRIRMVQGVPAGPSLRTPWAERSNFLAPQIWFIDKDDVATNLRAQNEVADQWGGKIDLGNYQFDVEVLRLGTPTALTGQIYDREAAETVLNSEGFQKRLKEGLVLGTLGGPLASARNDRPVDFNNVNLHDVALRVNHVELRDDAIIGDIQFVGPQAEAARALTYGEDYVYGLRAVVVKKIEDGVHYNKIQGIVTWDMVATR